jgi:hypothetical protein
MTDSNNLTLDKMMQAIQMFEAKMTAEEADTFLRLGVDGYKGYLILKHGGLVLVGGHERGGSCGHEIITLIHQMAPEVRLRLTEMLPDGQIYLLDTSLAEIARTT